MELAEGRKWQRRIYLDFTLSPGVRFPAPNIGHEYPAGNEKILGIDINLPVVGWYLTLFLYQLRNLMNVAYMEVVAVLRV